MIDQKGHGIPETLLKEVKNLTRKFFELPYEEKTKIKMTPEKGYRGYQRIGENITKGVPDIHEAIDVGLIHCLLYLLLLVMVSAMVISSVPFFRTDVFLFHLY